VDKVRDCHLEPDEVVAMDIHLVKILDDSVNGWLDATSHSLVSDSILLGRAQTHEHSTGAAAFALEGDGQLGCGIKAFSNKVFS
jgi:hypothetical protein